MWKMQYFSVIQILREINFHQSRSSQTANWHFGNFRGSEILVFGKFQPLKIAKKSLTFAIERL